MNTLTSLPKSTLVTLALLALVTIFAIGNVVSGYTEPDANPPAGNVVAPLNVGPTDQGKTGRLDIGGAQRYWIMKDGNSFALENNAGDIKFVVGQDGNVGIGTPGPGAKLDVAGTAAVDYLRIDPQNTTNEGGELQLVGAGSNPNLQIDNYQGHARIHTLQSGKQFQVLGGSSYFEGNVSIGTTGYSEKLAVLGNIRAVGDVLAGRFLDVNTQDASGNLVYYADPSGTSRFANLDIVNVGGLYGNGVRAMVFGGTFVKDNPVNGACLTGNVLTGGCSCPAGFSDYIIAAGVCINAGSVCGNNDTYDIHGCYR